MTNNDSSRPGTESVDSVDEVQQEKPDVAVDEAAAADSPERVEVKVSDSHDPEAGEEDQEMDVETLKAHLARAEREASEATARAQAEVQNLRRRLERDKENAAKFALEKFATELLNVADSLERGLESLDRENEVLAPAVEGTELTLKQLLEVFKKFNIEQINPVGEPFDPEFHEALTMVPNPDMEPNMVMDVIQPGFTLHGRLIRAARVVVSKAP